MKWLIGSVVGKWVLGIAIALFIGGIWWIYDSIWDDGYETAMAEVKEAQQKLQDELNAKAAAQVTDALAHQRAAETKVSELESVLATNEGKSVERIRTVYRDRAVGDCSVPAGVLLELGQAVESARATADRLRGKGTSTPDT